MKIFLSYGHNSNVPLIEKTKEYLSKDVEENLKSRESAHEFVITIKREPAVDDQESNQVTNQAVHQETRQVNRLKPRLTNEQQDIVNSCSVPRSAKEILDRKRLYNQSRARKKYILSIVEMGVLEFTIPETPTIEIRSTRE